MKISQINDEIYLDGRRVTHWFKQGGQAVTILVEDKYII